MAAHHLCAALTDLITDVGKEPDENIQEKISSAKYFHEKCLEEYFLSAEDGNSGEDPNVTPSSTKHNWIHMFYPPLLSGFGGGLGRTSSALAFTLVDQGCTPDSASALTDQ
eukprot:jgi/Psemu1/15627/gm1.15627_g